MGMGMGLASKSSLDYSKFNLVVSLVEQTNN